MKSHLRKTWANSFGDSREKLERIFFAEKFSYFSLILDLPFFMLHLFEHNVSERVGNGPLPQESLAVQIALHLSERVLSEAR